MLNIDLIQSIEEKVLLQHCAPIFFLPYPGAMPGSITNNGTVALLNTGRRKLLVTCHHVWSGFEEYRKEHPSARLGTVFADGFGQPVFVDELAMLDWDEGLDILIFEAAPHRWPMGGKEFFRIHHWPIPKAQKGEIVAFLGFAGEGRNTAGNIGQFSYTFFGLSITDSSYGRAVLAKDSSPRHLYHDDGTPRTPMRMGGLSGSPAYVRDRTGAFSLTGFVSMGNTSADDIFLTHAAFINPDGSLNIELSSS